MDQAGQRDPGYLADPQVKDLIRRAQALGMCEYEELPTTAGTRF
jgi:hypothetical protein